MDEFYNDIITNDSAPIMELAERYLGLDYPAPEQEHTDNDIYESAVDNISQVISDYEEPEASMTDDISGSDICIQDMLDDYLDDVYDDFIYHHLRHMYYDREIGDWEKIYSQVCAFVQIKPKNVVECVFMESAVE